MQKKLPLLTLRLLLIILLPIVFLFFLYGLIFLWGIFIEFHIIGLMLGLAALLGFPGYLAALYRVFRPSPTLTQNQVRTLRYLFSSGILSACLLAGLVAYAELSILPMLPFLMLAAGGVAFLKATPLPNASEQTINAINER